MKKNYFTLMEMLVVMAIMMILFSIGVVAFNKAANSADITQTVAQVQMLDDAIEKYRDRFGSLPPMDRSIVDGEMYGAFNFAEKLSKVEVGDNRWSGKRPMFVDYNKVGFDIDGSGYDDHNASDYTIYDAWGDEYLYFRHVSSIDGESGIDADGDGEDDGLSAGKDEFIVISISALEHDGQDIYRITAQYEDSGSGVYKWVITGWYEDSGTKKVDITDSEDLIMTGRN